LILPHSHDQRVVVECTIGTQWRKKCSFCGFEAYYYYFFFILRNFVVHSYLFLSDYTILYTVYTRWWNNIHYVSRHTLLRRIFIVLYFIYYIVHLSFEDLRLQKKVTKVSRCKHRIVRETWFFLFVTNNPFNRKDCSSDHNFSKLRIYYVP